MSEFGEGAASCWKPARATFAIPPGRSDHECSRAVGKAYAGPVSAELFCYFSGSHALPHAFAAGRCRVTTRLCAGFDHISKVHLRCAQLLAVRQH